MSDNEMDYTDVELQSIERRLDSHSGEYEVCGEAAEVMAQLRARVAELEAERDGWTRAYDSAARDRDYQKQRVAELEADHRTLQQDGRHPAPCARHCEAAAFSAEISLRDSRIGELERQLSQSDSDLGLACRGAVDRGREIETLEAENNRMRGALEQIAAGGRVDVRSLARTGLNSQGDGEHES